MEENAPMATAIDTAADRALWAKAHVYLQQQGWHQPGHEAQAAAFCAKMAARQPSLAEAWQKESVFWQNGGHYPDYPRSRTMAEEQQTAGLQRPQLTKDAVQAMVTEAREHLTARRKELGLDATATITERTYGRSHDHGYSY
jgi:hypothetical protein